MESDKGTVCVTGGTGFIASWLIKRLLEEGYSVRTTVRENKRDLSFLTSLPRADEKLKIFSADLSDPDSFDAAVEGSKGVFHVATPVDFGNKEPDLEMMDESFWSDLDFVREKITHDFASYIISKTLTERAVLEFGAQHGLDVVTVIPSLVVGPFICSKFPGSVRSSLAPVLGNSSLA
ncbi:hypothetical protein GQ457_01G055750 [Hibiscus cannabinus]